MKRPAAYPTTPSLPEAEPSRSPRAYEPEGIALEEPDFAEAPGTASFDVAPQRRRLGWPGRVALAAGGALLSLALWVWLDALIRDLFAKYEWLGWGGLALAGVFLVALLILLGREAWALRRLRQLDHVRRLAELTLVSDRHADGLAIARQLHAIYGRRPDLARIQRDYEAHLGQIFDGSEMIRFSERTLLSPLDQRARSLTAASARRVALVTAVSPRALIDVAFVIYESVRLAGAVAALYGARPGLLGFFRLTGAVLSHLAVTGGLVLTDGIVEQLIGQGLAARLSARLGEGVVNGLMTVRVGIAAMRVVRPLPFDALRPPHVRDFLPELMSAVRDGRPQD